MKQITILLFTLLLIGCKGVQEVAEIKEIVKIIESPKVGANNAWEELDTLTVSMDKNSPEWTILLLQNELYKGNKDILVDLGYYGPEFDSWIEQNGGNKEKYLYTSHRAIIEKKAFMLQDYASIQDEDVKFKTYEVPISGTDRVANMRNYTAFIVDASKVLNFKVYIQVTKKEEIDKNNVYLEYIYLYPPAFDENPIVVEDRAWLIKKGGKWKFDVGKELTEIDKESPSNVRRIY